MWAIIMLKDWGNASEGDVVAREDDYEAIVRAWHRLYKKYGKGFISQPKFNIY